MKLDAFDYTLPSEMIAKYPAEPREAARLLDLSCNGYPRGKWNLLLASPSGRYGF